MEKTVYRNLLDFAGNLEAKQSRELFDLISKYREENHQYVLGIIDKMYKFLK